MPESPTGTAGASLSGAADGQHDRHRSFVSRIEHDADCSWS
jgi:hypothetical protein